jgi:ribosomal protein L12E/L44/L45/RPP1/RPP2
VIRVPNVKENEMQKKAFYHVADTIVTSVIATVASDPALTVEEARTMVAVHLKKNMSRIVGEIAASDAVLIVAPAPKAKKTKEDATEANTEANTEAS